MTVVPAGGDSGWRLAIDFGTVFTVAAIGRGTSSQVLDIEGDGTNRLHSGVLLEPTGSLAVGSVARHQADFLPDRYEPTPKRSIGEGRILLGDRTVRIVDVVAAVLARVGTEARRAAGGTAPTKVVVTHPADWAATRLGVLTEATRRAGLSAAVLLPEPVAAAIHIGAATVAVGGHIAIYDFGGGTFDAAVLRRTVDGYEVAGPPGGRDPLGGEDLDHRIIEHLGQGSLGEHPDWQKLLSPPDLQWRRASSAFRDAVRGAKEGLSTTTAWQIWVPGIEREVQVTRGELEAVIRQDVDLTVDVLVETVAAAGITPNQLAGVYLVGGSSRIPLIAQTIWDRLGLEPNTYDDPKAVVALGAAEQGLGAEAAAAAAPEVGVPMLPPPLPMDLAPGAGAPPVPWSGAASAPQPTESILFTTRRLVAFVSLVAVVVAAAIAVVLVRRGADAGPTGTASPGPTPVSLSGSQLGTVVPTPQEIGTGFTKAQVTESLSDLRICNAAPQLAGLLAESTTVATGSANSAVVVVDAAQFASGRAGDFLQSEASALQGCQGAWTTAGPNGQLSVTSQQVNGSQLGDQTFRIDSKFTDASGNTAFFQELTAARLGDALVLVVVQDSSTNDHAKADSLASGALDKLRAAVAAASGG